MVELKCQFASVVYAELYRTLQSEPSIADALSARLEEIEYEPDWLITAAEAYEQKWQSDLQYATPETVKDFALTQPDHAILATWILAGLRNTGHCQDISGELESRVMTRALDDLPGMSLPLPSVLSPVIYGWTLGCVVGPLDLPAVPAVLPPEENVQQAFAGFVEHVLHLQQMAVPWPEMMSTAIYWRGYGIAEGLLPERASGGNALTQLKSEASRSMPSAVFRSLDRYFQTFNVRRHAVSHVAVDASRPTFIEVAQTIREWTDLRMGVLGLTQFAFQEVSKYLQDQRPHSIRSSTWDNLMPEIRVDW